ncbi:phage tail assembly chaperone [Methylobacterium platani]|uniref:phage tail assembly chaperone n=1 Tax=Methylobacterium platani TaxID=427683 RepID=UPI003CC91522
MDEERRLEGKPPPPALLQRPELPELASLAWDAFWDLTGERPLGFGAQGRIPWSAVDRWGARYAIAGEQFTRLKRIVQALDAAWLEHMNKPADKQPPTGG